MRYSRVFYKFYASVSEYRVRALGKVNVMDPAQDLAIREKVGFLGSGNMAQAIAEGLIKTGTIPAANIIASSPSQKSSAKWVGLGAKHTNNNVDVIEQSDVIFIAVKPHLVDVAINSWRIDGSHRAPSKLFISVVAGTTVETLEEKLNGITLDPRVVRAMTNTPMTVGAGCSVYSGGRKATQQDLHLVKRLLSAGGICEEVPQNLINAIGALAGSGPAFVS
ncbi:hypothetical protein J437_LFUL010611 [Ladona fulva]|uniref:Pyrroline-5-carboxylate reductase catalytic N-terminal domain-containing protein n=1 Tax=Ladona fulva TaxID=123851 RepID=A0A8K0P3Z2_LADFU|nr:hypothetical protein J437_LFUL010611 [Ladona fulva]